MLKRHLDRYLAVRRAAGAKLHDAQRNLVAFVAWLGRRGIVTSADAVEWAGHGGTPRARARRLSHIVNFVRYLLAEDPRHELPPSGVFGPAYRRQPRWYPLSRADIAAILADIGRFVRPDEYAATLYRTAVGLLAVTGMRVSEALSLRRDDITPDGLLVRNTKFGKTRLVPVHATTVAALQRFLRLRSRVGSDDTWVFVHQDGHRLGKKRLLARFSLACRRVGLDAKAGMKKPRLHDLRHAFATRSLEQATSSGLPLARHMVALATFLGHASLREAYWYEHPSTAVLAQVRDALEASLRGGEKA